jgi:hypothetical protein
MFELSYSTDNARTLLTLVADTSVIVTEQTASE